MTNVQNRIRLEQAIRAHEASGDRLRAAVLDVIGDGPLRSRAAAYGLTDGALRPWKSGEGVPSLRAARLVLKKAREEGKTNVDS